MDGETEGQMNKPHDEQKNRQIKLIKNRWKDEWRDRWTDGWADRWTTNGHRDGQTEIGWTDRGGQT